MAVDIQINVAATSQTLCQRRSHSRYLFRCPLHSEGSPVYLVQVTAGNLGADWALDAGGQHIDAVADGRDPDVGQPRHTHSAIKLLDELLRGHSWTPFTLGLEPNGGLEHLQRCRVGS
ncbi:hypothetical protein D3C81_598430 [compost metagenome]